MRYRMIPAVKLDRLFLRTEWTEERLARAALMDQSTVNRLRRNKRVAGLGLALRIESATGGLVKAEHVPMSPSSRRDLRAIRACAVDEPAPGAAA